MKINRIEYSSKFLRNLRRLPPELKSTVDERIKIFKLNCFDPRLKTHKLDGKWKDCWSFSLDFSNRIVFEFLEENAAGFIDVGNHDIYK